MFMSEKPIKSRAQLFPCPHYVFCDIFNCRGIAKWFVGRPDGPRQATFKLCDNCARDLVGLVPDELRDDGATMEMVKQQLTEQIRAELDKKYAAELRELEEKLLTAQATIEALQESQPEKGKPDENPEPDETDEEKPQIYRCLDCNYEASSAEELAEHKKDHDAPPSEESPEEEKPQEPKKSGSLRKMTPQERLALRRGQR